MVALAGKGNLTDRRQMLALGAPTVPIRRARLQPQLLDGDMTRLSDFHDDPLVGFWAARPGAALPDKVVANRVAEETYEVVPVTPGAYRAVRDPGIVGVPRTLCWFRGTSGVSGHAAGNARLTGCRPLYYACTHEYDNHHPHRPSRFPHLSHPTR